MSDGFEEEFHISANICEVTDISVCFYKSLFSPVYIATKQVFSDLSWPRVKIA